MSYQIVKNHSRSRFLENNQFLNYISSQEPINLTMPVPLEVNIMKGLFYVHLYSSFEKTINELVENTILLINNNSIKNKHYNFNFNTIALHNKLQSFKNSGYKSFFSKACEIFTESNSNKYIILNETVFATNLQNVWVKTIEEVSQCFGIKGLNICPITRTNIDEIVNKRNSVAHGRESAADVGSRYRVPEIRKKYDNINAFTYELIDLYEKYYLNKDFLKNSTKRYYP